MKIKIIENEKPKMPKCSMNCDGGLSTKLEKYELTKFLNGHETQVFCGKPKSGKTSLAYSFFKSPLRKVFHNIYLFQPSHSWSSMDDSIFDTLPDENKYDELNEENLYEVLGKIKEEAKGGYNSCILFDDVGAAYKDNQIQKILREIIFNRRHYHVNCYFLVQSWKSVPLTIRKLFTNIFLFKVSKKEFEEITDEILEIRKEFIQPIMKQVFSEPYKWMFINTTENRIFDGFNEMLFDEE